MISVIIPAYNEASVIERSLEALVRNARPGELEVIVVCNGCHDQTASLARHFGDPVRVIETDVASKSHALNVGDEAASGFPRFYVDADIILTIEAVRDVASMLTDDSSTLAAAPRAIVDYQNRSRLVQAFYEVWTQLPYFAEGGSGGVYGFSRAGRARFDKFPDIIADDEYARLTVGPDRRKCSQRSTFIIQPPTTLRGVLAIMTRAHAGNYELRKRCPELMRSQNTASVRSAWVIARTPRLWRCAPVYLGVMSLAKLGARLKLLCGREKRWNRDETSRSSRERGIA